MEEVSAATFKAWYTTNDDYHYTTKDNHTTYYVFVWCGMSYMYTKVGDKYYFNGVTKYLYQMFQHLQKGVA